MILSSCCIKRSLSWCDIVSSPEKCRVFFMSIVYLCPAQLLRRHLAVSSWPQSGHSTWSLFMHTVSRHLAVKGFPHSRHSVSLASLELSCARLYLLEQSEPCSCWRSRLPPPSPGSGPDTAAFCFVILRLLFPSKWWLVEAWAGGFRRWWFPGNLFSCSWS